MLKLFFLIICNFRVKLFEDRWLNLSLSRHFGAASGSLRKKEGCLTESLFLFCQIIIDNQFTQTLIHAVQNQLLSRCMVTRTSTVVVTSSVVVSSRVRTLAPRALIYAHHEAAYNPQPAVPKHMSRCECSRCRFVAVRAL